MMRSIEAGILFTFVAAGAGLALANAAAAAGLEAAAWAITPEDASASYRS